MAKENRIITIELRLLAATDEQYQAAIEMTAACAKDLHAMSAMLTTSKPVVTLKGSGGIHLNMNEMLILQQEKGEVE
jgi:hypothetical protein